MKRIVIAIDGYAGCGKSSTARQVAKVLNYLYIDSGAMYRAVALYFLRHHISFDHEHNEMREALDNIYIDFVQKDEHAYPHVKLNGYDVEDDIRKPEVTQIVSQVSVHEAVRREMVQQQQRMGEDKGVVMDGRDIGTVVFPNAELKIFMTASIDARAKRRQLELKQKGIDQSLESISASLESRDHIDSTRKIGPLKQAEDAIVIDTTDITLNEQVEQVLSFAYEVMGRK